MPGPATNPPAPIPAHRSYIWWCPACRRQEPFTAGDLADYARAGWPVCCGGKVMCHYAERVPEAPEK
jgi:hypothetical protein